MDQFEPKDCPLSREYTLAGEESICETSRFEQTGNLDSLRSNLNVGSLKTKNGTRDEDNVTPTNKKTMKSKMSFDGLADMLG